MKNRRSKKMGVLQESGVLMGFPPDGFFIIIIEIIIGVPFTIHTQCP
jgi:hypothetical protein